MVPETRTVPLISPVEGFIVRPVGNPFSIQVYGGMPPVASILCEYGAPRVAGGSCLGVVIARALGLMTTENAFDEVTAAVSPTVTVNANVPGPVGVPERTPETGSSSRPGTNPEEIVHV
jgi:hypothetical protein